MNKNIEFVIGAGYGSEKKGSIISHLVEKYKSDRTIVIRFNGGVNATHIVEKDGVKHTFRHFGSGTLHGCATLLTGDFVLNPTMFRKEYKQLESNGIKPVVYVNKDLKVTMPVFEYINQIQFLDRDFCNKGMISSSGYGIEEATKVLNMVKEYRDGVPRTPEEEYCLLYNFLDRNFEYSQNKMNNMLEWYNSDYFLNNRTYKLGVSKGFRESKFYNKYLEMLRDSDLINEFIEDFKFMLSKIIIVSGDGIESELYPSYDNFILESLLGLNSYYYGFLGVDFNSSYLSEIFNSCRNSDEIKVNINYVSRWYYIKKGTGFVKHSCDCEKLGLHESFIENLDDDWQVAVKYGQLDVRHMFRAIKRDYDSISYPLRNGITTDVNLYVTALNQLPFDTSFDKDFVCRTLIRNNIKSNLFNKFYNLKDCIGSTDILLSDLEDNSEDSFDNIKEILLMKYGVRKFNKIIIKREYRVDPITNFCVGEKFLLKEGKFREIEITKEEFEMIQCDSSINIKEIE